jgi:hypothetical protein
MLHRIYASESDLNETDPEMVGVNSMLNAIASPTSPVTPKSVALLAVSPLSVMTSGDLSLTSTILPVDTTTPELSPKVPPQNVPNASAGPTIDPRTFESWADDGTKAD